MVPIDRVSARKGFEGVGGADDTLAAEDGARRAVRGGEDVVDVVVVAHEVVVADVFAEVFDQWILGSAGGFGVAGFGLGLAFFDGWFWVCGWG